MSVQSVYDRLKPKPPELLQNPRREFVREGSVQMWSDPERKFKNRHLFLFNDVLLIAKKMSPKSFKLRVYVTFKPSIQVESGGVGVEFSIVAPERSFRILAEDPNERAQWVIDIQRGLEESGGGQRGGGAKGGRRGSREERGGSSSSSGRREGGGGGGGLNDAVGRYDNEVVDYHDDSDEKPKRRDRDRERDRDRDSRGNDRDARGGGGGGEGRSEREARGEREGRSDRDRAERAKERDSRGGDKDRDRKQDRNSNTARPAPPSQAPQSAALLLAFDSPSTPVAAPAATDPFATLASRRTGNSSFNAPSPGPVGSPGTGGAYFGGATPLQQPYGAPPAGFGGQPSPQQPSFASGGSFSGAGLAGGVKVMPDAGFGGHMSAGGGGGGGGSNPWSGDQMAALAALQHQPQHRPQHSDPFGNTFGAGNTSGSFAPSSPYGAPYSAPASSSGAIPPLSGGGNAFAAFGSPSAAPPPLSGGPSGSGAFNLAAFQLPGGNKPSSYSAPATPFGASSPAPPVSGGNMFTTAGASGGGPRPTSPRTFNTTAFNTPSSASFSTQQAAYSPFGPQPGLGSPVAPSAAPTKDVKQMSLDEINAEIARLQNKPAGSPFGAGTPPASSQPAQPFFGGPSSSSFNGSAFASTATPSGGPMQFTQAEVDAEMARMKAEKGGGGGGSLYQPMPVPGQQQFASPFGASPHTQPPTSNSLMDQQALQYQLQMQQQQGGGQRLF